MVQAVMPKPTANPTQQAAPDFIPAEAPDFIPSTGDAAASAPTAPQQQPGFLENIGHSFGIGTSEANAQMETIRQHPVRSTIEAMGGPAVPVMEGLWGGAKRIGGELLQAGKEAHGGNPAGAGVHAVKAIPFIGPAMDKMADEAPPTKPGQSYGSKILDAATPGNIGTAIGTAAQIAPIALGGVDIAAPTRPLMGQLPSASRAGATLQSIREAAADVPVSMERTAPELARFRELTQRGGRASKPFTQFYGRYSDESGAPITFPEARDFYTNLNDATNQTPIQKIMGRGMKPTMRRQGLMAKHALNEDLTSAAETIGRGQEYTGAMSEYANAMKLRKAIRVAGLLGAGEAARRTGLLGNWIHRTALQQ